MEFKTNYFSAVAIGGFNPSILTPDFLRECCKFESQHKPVGQTTPVATRVQYGSLQFLMELNRFQIMVQETEELGDQNAIDILLRYLEVLKYTPLVAVGINFNYTLHALDVEMAAEKFKDPFQIQKTLDIIPTAVVLEAKKANGLNLKLAEITVTHALEAGVKNAVKASFEADSLTINDNYEVNELDRDRDRIQLLKSKYGIWLEHARAFISKVGGA